ncbi:MAG: hypothetical protein PVH91_10380 [Pseudomonadales bacterium]|jgi:hypothetical protein
MSDFISTDHPLNPEQRVLLAALLDTLIPASEDGRMPAASETGFDTYLLTQAEGFLPELVSILEHFDASFPDLPLARRCEDVTTLSTANPEGFRSLLTRVYDCYYQNDRVRLEIGVVAGAPFPQGNEVMPGDLSLLDPVIADSGRHGYRKA